MYSFSLEGLSKNEDLSINGVSQKHHELIRKIHLYLQASSGIFNHRW